MQIFAQSKAYKIKVDSIAPGFWLYQSYGSYNGQTVSANGLLYQSTTGLVLLDTPWDGPQTLQLLNWIDSTIHKPLAFCLYTHAHDDRVGGLDTIYARKIPAYASAATIAKLPMARKPKVTAVKNTDTTFYSATTPIEFYYPGAGHTTDNMVVWFPRQKLLYGGCFIKTATATTLGNTTEADLTKWAANMQKLINRYPNAAIVIPGHDDWRNKGAIQHTLDLLKQGK